MKTERRNTPRSATAKREWDQACIDIARVLQCEPHQIEMLTIPPGMIHYADVTVGGKVHRVSMEKVAKAKRDAAQEAINARHRNFRDQTNDAFYNMYRSDEQRRDDNAHPFKVMADGTIDLHPSQFRVVSVTR